MDGQYHNNMPFSQQPGSTIQSSPIYADARQQLPPQLPQLHQPTTTSQQRLYSYSNHPPNTWTSASWQPNSSVIPSTTSPSMAMLMNSGAGIIGITGAPSAPSRPKLTTTLWEDEGTLCYQVDARGICVARRQDNDMINGTKLLNVVGMSRGKRDGILKNEKGRVVVKVGAMHLKGVWITFSRAKALATQFKIIDLLFPLFVDDPAIYLYPSPGAGSNASSRLSGTSTSFGSGLPAPFRPHPSINSFNNQWDLRNSPHQSSPTSQRFPSATSISASSSLQTIFPHDQVSQPNAGLRSHNVTTPAPEEEIYLLNSPFDGEDVYVHQQGGAPTISPQNIGVARQRNAFPTPVSNSPASSPSPSMLNSGAAQQMGSYSPQQRPGRVPSPRHHPYGGGSLQRSSSYSGPNLYGYGQQNMATYNDRSSPIERDSGRPGATQW